MSQLQDDADQTDGAVLVPLERVAVFVRHFSHDVRNMLNAMDLQSAFAVELASDPELSAELKKIRGLISNGARMLQGVSSNFSVGQPNLVDYSARILVEDLRDRMARLLPDRISHVDWVNDLHEETIAVDLEMFCSAAGELVKNAFDFGEPGNRIAVRASANHGVFAFELHQARTAVATPPEEWGCEPLLSTRRGGYGLSLYHAREILKVHRGEITFTHDAAAAMLVTRMTLPLVGSAK